MNSGTQQRTAHPLLLICIAATAILGSAEAAIAWQRRSLWMLLLAGVTIGTGYDFFGAHSGLWLKKTKALIAIAQTRFSLLNFGILFTPLSAAFILSKAGSPQLCMLMTERWLPILIVSLATGGMFLCARYRFEESNDGPVYVLDKSDRFTRIAFVIRRIILTAALAIWLITLIEGLQTPFALWTSLYSAAFIATVPLHILRMERASMALETATLMILFYGAWQVMI